jgi:hypothetical protein
MVDPAAQVLAPEADRVVIQRVAPPVIAGPVMAVQVGRTTPGVRGQDKVVRAGRVVLADQVVRADKVVSPVSRADIPSGKWLVPNRYQGKRAAAPTRMAVVVPGVVDAIVDAGQTLAEGLAVRAIGNVSRVNFRGKRPRVDHRSNLGRRDSRARKVFPVRQVFLGLLVERAHRDHRASQVPRVIRTLRGLPFRRIAPVHPVGPAHPVRRGLLGLPALRGSQDFRVMMAQ